MQIDSDLNVLYDSTCAAFLFQHAACLVMKAESLEAFQERCTNMCGQVEDKASASCKYYTQPSGNICPMQESKVADGKQSNEQGE